MSREIKFRAWDKNKKKMLREENDQEGSRDEVYADEWDTFLYALNSIDEDNYVLMQYTGLKDANGKEIYEGDIVKDGNWVAKVPTLDEFIEQAMSPGIEMPDYRNTEIIGNVWENPELIKTV